MINPATAAWDERLQCSVVSLAYDFGTHKGRLYLQDGDCCDMEGCLELFEAIDPTVTAITTYSGDQEDTLYRKHGTEWQAILPRNA